MLCGRAWALHAFHLWVPCTCTGRPSTEEQERSRGTADLAWRGSRTRRGKELQETGGVFDFTYEMYLSKELPMADVSAKVRGNDQEYYEVSATVDEEFGDVTEYRCNW